MTDDRLCSRFTMKFFTIHPIQLLHSGSQGVEPIPADIECRRGYTVYHRATKKDKQHFTLAPTDSFVPSSPQEHVLGLSEEPENLGRTTQAQGEHVKCMHFVALSEKKNPKTFLMNFL